jgi:peptidoglycan L-alanyl-D-glutamate endopeptidase CwlK
LAVKAVKFLKVCELVGHPGIIYCTFRSFDEQQARWDQGRTKAGKIVTYARAGHSAHNARRLAEGGPDAGSLVPAALAFDFVFGTRKKVFWEGPWDEIAYIAKTFFGLQWGGDWRKLKDKVHFYEPNWRDLAEE